MLFNLFRVVGVLPILTIDLRCPRIQARIMQSAAALFLAQLGTCFICNLVAFTTKHYKIIREFIAKPLIGDVMYFQLFRPFAESAHATPVLSSFECLRTALLPLRRPHVDIVFLAHPLWY